MENKIIELRNSEIAFRNARETSQTFAYVSTFLSIISFAFVVVFALIAEPFSSAFLNFSFGFIGFAGIALFFYFRVERLTKLWQNAIDEQQNLRRANN